MVVINCAYTEQINPSGESPVISREQIWRALQRKIRHAQDFVPVISGTDVLEDKDTEVTRIAHMKDGRSVKEVCKSYYPLKVDFIQSDGAVITNTVSDGMGWTEHDYYMTYSFEIRHPDKDAAPGSEEYQKLYKAGLDGAKQAVHHSIVSMRRMAKAGELD